MFDCDSGKETHIAFPIANMSFLAEFYGGCGGMDTMLVYARNRIKYLNRMEGMSAATGDLS